MSWRAAQLIPLSTPGPPRRARVWRRIGGYIPAARYDRIWRRTRHPIHQAAVQTVPTDQPNGRLIVTGDGIDVRTRSSKACSKPFWRAVHHRGLTQRGSSNPGESMPGVRPNRANANLRRGTGRRRHHATLSIRPSFRHCLSPKTVPSCTSAQSQNVTAIDHEAHDDRLTVAPGVRQGQYSFILSGRRADARGTNCLCSRRR
jgi:hypothetical protein